MKSVAVDYWDTSLLTKSAIYYCRTARIRAPDSCMPIGPVMIWSISPMGYCFLRRAMRSCFATASRSSERCEANDWRSSQAHLRSGEPEILGEHRIDISHAP